jgi:hypothetical protein
MARKKSKERRKRERRKLLQAANRAGDLEARIIQRIGCIEDCIRKNIIQTKGSMNAIQGHLNAATTFLNYLEAFPDRRHALIGLLLATGYIAQENSYGKQRFSIRVHSKGEYDIILINPSPK